MSAVDQTVVSGITAAIETSVNHALSYDPATRQRVADITDILAVNITTPAITLYFRGHTDGVHVMGHCEAPVVTQLSGSIIDLIGLLKQPTSLANSNVALTGSTHLLQQWQTLLQDMDIDWEEAISRILGDIAGPFAASGIHTAVDWSKSQLQEQQRLIKEYVSEELKLTPSKAETEHFFDQVHELKLNVDRMNARIQALHQKLDKSQHTMVDDTQAHTDTATHTNNNDGKVS